ncbi:hypothetical protein A3H10_04605 [Candidatus Uhrbacteria bacterium RIFCSPLOWO2_12_FULL_46_10]|uniref:Uncharacterized protein n=1 Tax=Candidatus Uhrbacteria bacterium RIFCSPLOWO2_01_FULL_47_25 TaxID=1802402 RepID=A0A1F7UW43_9BACT|nr:MAG: hypothetical protein UX68_C0006G0026 [Parcubacteria group bacterium GW2011_GWA2_46_9]OGL59378.1 MAG: hypothetical protein A2752_05470 [Candidatus Uhrbacteria bacterium RIFCSPHIGHO2_01_FULL_46_23]OGL82476.1 MAG: hypothetical protein A2936_02355 [Candidatus Uhrbacteria bacterium RIFCSPLOWO2_01_FULL_47_25]OGL85910.1 MAG: hypothetical protein A3I37_00960 [Candidatus Uhrbacteria bacterium RIFCSPLOWO2_02_FULL_46_19]OGL91042.1 MAG: hypothetical protein A3H10_04605 [Candidatus Uhrbacteria bacte
MVAEDLMRVFVCLKVDLYHPTSKAQLVFVHKGCPSGYPSEVDCIRQRHWLGWLVVIVQCRRCGRGERFRSGREWRDVERALLQVLGGLREIRVGQVLFLWKKTEFVSLPGRPKDSVCFPDMPAPANEVGSPVIRTRKLYLVQGKGPPRFNA